MMSYEKRVKIIPHGYLKEIIPEPIEMTGFNMLEIINGLSRQIKGLQPELDQEMRYLTIMGFEEEDKLRCPIPANCNEVHLVPAMCGGKGGIFKIIAGIGLIALSFYLPVGWSALGGMITSASFFNFGLSLVLGGLLEVLSPAPKIDRTGNTESDPEASKYLGANQNTTKIGTRIILAYGENRLYGHYLSFDIDAKDVAL